MEQRGGPLVDPATDNRQPPTESTCWLAGGSSGILNAAVQDDRYDAIVIGGGPAGSAAATRLAMAGRKALVLEKEVFPRFHIGESLLPYNQKLFRELDLLGELENLGFPRKRGAQFHLGNGSKSIKILFREGRFNSEHETFQVERAVFDEVLLRHAEKKGAEVREGMSVTGVENDASGVRVTARDGAGETRTFEGVYLVDATGRSNFTAKRDGLCEVDPRLKNLAVFAHFSGVKLDEGERAGDTVIVRVKDGWFWLIPIGNDKTSVGAVLPTAAYKEMGASPDEALQRRIDSCLEMRERMAKAERLIAARTTVDYTYSNRELTGPRLIRAGDAVGFIDPIFSAGVYLAMRSGKESADSIVDALTGRRSERRAFAAYEKRVRRSMAFNREMIDRYYTTEFMEVFLEPRTGLFGIVDAVNGALAGQFGDSWRLRWRLRLFFRLVRLQGRKPFLPRITFD